MEKDGRQISEDDLSFMYLMTQIDDETFDKLFNTQSDGDFDDADQMLVKRKEGVENIVDVYQNMELKPFVRKIDMNYSEDDLTEIKPSEAVVAGVEISF